MSEVIDLLPITGREGDASSTMYERFKNGEITITMSAVMILSLVGVSLDIETWSALQPEGRLLRAEPDGKGVVRLFDKAGEKLPFVFKPGVWGAYKRLRSEVQNEAQKE